MLLKNSLLFALVISTPLYVLALDDAIIKEALTQQPAISPAPASASQMPIKSAITPEVQPTEQIEKPQATPIYDPGMPATKPMLYNIEDEPTQDEELNDAEEHPLNRRPNNRFSFKIQGMPMFPGFGRAPIIPHSAEHDEYHHTSRFDDEPSSDMDFDTLNRKIQEAKADLEKAEAILKKATEQKNSSPEFQQLQKTLLAKKQTDIEYKTARDAFERSRAQSDDAEAFEEYQRASFKYSKLVRRLAHQRR